MAGSIWELTEDALDGLGVALAANVMVEGTGTALPDQFIVYQLISSPPELHADDAETLRSYRMQVTVYNRAGLISLPDVEGAMVTAGFRKSMFRELPYNTLTRHYGLAMEFIYLGTGAEI